MIILPGRPAWVSQVRCHLSVQPSPPSYRPEHLEYRLLKAIQAGDRRSSTDLPTSDADDPAYDANELRAAVKRMRDADLITRHGSGQADRLRVTPTPLGETVLESGYAPSDYTTATQEPLGNNHTDNGINVTHSPGSAVSTGTGNATSSGNVTTTSPAPRNATTSGATTQRSWSSPSSRLSSSPLLSLGSASENDWCGAPH